MVVLSEMRLAAGIDVSLLTKLLSVSKYAYAAYEDGSRKIPEETMCMLAKIYDVDIDVFRTGMEEKTKKALLKIKLMSKDDKKKHLTRNLLGDGIKLTYNNVNRMKKKILNDLCIAKGSGTP